MKTPTELIALVGPSGCGKSTLAHKWWNESPLTRRIVSYDTIRMLLYGYNESTLGSHYSRTDLRSLEKSVVAQANNIIYDLINTEGVSQILLDNTNLKQKYIANLRYWNIPVTLIPIVADKEVVIERDSKRTKHVGKEVIDRQFEAYRKIYPHLTNISSSIQPIEFANKGDKECIIFDIDGTLAHNTGRSPYDWKSVGEDEVDQSTTAMLHSLINDISHYGNHPNPKVFICTGRDEESRESTLEWLDGNGFYFESDDVFFRKNKDIRPDWVVKEEMWREISSQGYKIVGMFDDRNQVVRRARSLGLKVFHVDHNNF